MMSAPLKVLVVDDAAIYRKIVAQTLRSMPDVEVVGAAANGRAALDKIQELRPDLITLDVEMPELDGVQLLRRLRVLDRHVGVVMLSAFTSGGAATTTEALSLGAFDFVLKPSGPDVAANHALLAAELTKKVAAFDARRRRALPAESRTSSISTAAEVDVKRSPPEVVCLGISTGGPEALGKMLPQLPADLPVPMFVVQHMPPLFTKSLADDLDSRCRLRVSEGVDSQLVGPGEIVIAPGGRHMRIERQPPHFVVRLSDDPPENSCRPAVDYLFRSAARICGARTLAVIMTGMGSDGTQGLRELKRLGAPIIAQDEATCVVFGMPAQPIAEALVDVVAPLQNVAEQITLFTRRREAVCR
jgi:two-component system chemotaxis response regulator CheB